MGMAALGRILFGLGFAILGAHEFALVWPPAPGWIAGHNISVIGFGAIFLAGGLALLVPRSARMGALGLAGFRLSLLFLLQIPYLAAHPLFELAWYDLSENLTLIAGAWTIFSLLPQEGAALANFGNVRAGQVFFALAMPAIGLSHFFYVDHTASLIPSWLPFHMSIAYLTGAAHIAAGLGILFGILPRLAATLEAVMMSFFTFIIWVPALIVTPAAPSNWSEFCISTALSGAAWAVAASFQGRSWGIERATA